jgi:hypothetical protein
MMANCVKPLRKRGVRCQVWLHSVQTCGCTVFKLVAVVLEETTSVANTERGNARAARLEPKCCSPLLTFLTCCGRAFQQLGTAPRSSRSVVHGVAPYPSNTCFGVLACWRVGVLPCCRRGVLWSWCAAMCINLFGMRYLLV